MVRSQRPPGLTIGGLAEAVGVGVETVRYYQRRGLLPPAQPRKGVRRYGPDMVRRLSFIRAAPAAGFTLDEIGRLLQFDADQDHLRVREMAQTRIAALDRQIAALTAARDALLRLTRQCVASDGRAPCPIIKSFENDAGGA